MKREFIREYESEEELPVREKVRIGVIGLNQGNGCSFVASAVACEIAKRREYSVAFAEVKEGVTGSSLLYDAMAIDRRFKNRKFEKIYNALKGRLGIRDVFNMEEGINWALMTPEENAAGVYLNLVEKVSLINNIAGDVVVFDLSDYGDRQELDVLIAEMDTVLAVVDPMPSKLIAAKGLMDFFKQKQVNSVKSKPGSNGTKKSSGTKIIWVINKFNDGVHRHKLRDYVKLKNAVQIPAVKQEHFYAAEYNCRIPYMQKEIRHQVQKSIVGLADLCMPENSL